MARTPLVFLALLAAATTTACGGSVNGAGSPPPADDGGCSRQAPTPGSPCTADESICQIGDIACTGYWVCSSAHTWQKEYPGAACQLDSGRPADAFAGDASPFSCGTMTCNASQYCADAPGGADAGPNPPDPHSCVPLPAACASNPTCSCVVPLVDSSCLNPTCTQNGDQVFVTCMSG